MFPAGRRRKGRALRMDFGKQHHQRNKRFLPDATLLGIYKGTPPMPHASPQKIRALLGDFVQEQWWLLTNSSPLKSIVVGRQSFLVEMALFGGTFVRFRRFSGVYIYICIYTRHETARGCGHLGLTTCKVKNYSIPIGSIKKAVYSPTLIP